MTDSWNMAYNQRQYRLMDDRLAQFEEGSLNIASLIKNMKSLLSALENVDDAWKEKFQSEWGVLESVYAVTLYHQEQGLIPGGKTTINDSADLEIINEAVQKMRRLVRERIAGANIEEEDGG